MEIIDVDRTQSTPPPPTSMTIKLDQYELQVLRLVIEHVRLNQSSSAAARNSVERLQNISSKLKDQGVQLPTNFDCGVFAIY